MTDWRNHNQILDEVEEIRNTPQTGTAFNAQQNKLQSNLISVVIDLINTTINLDKQNKKLQNRLLVFSVIAAILIIVQILFAIPRKQSCFVVVSSDAPNIQKEDCVNKLDFGVFGSIDWKSHEEKPNTAF